MPSYEYACGECGETFTVTHPMLSVNPQQIFCPHCYSMEINRVWHPIPVHYKGHGFYTTDVASEKEFE